MYEKMCPLINDKCRGSQCSFACPKHKTSVDTDGDIKFEKDGWYCLVRDFLITISSRE